MEEIGLGSNPDNIEQVVSGLIFSYNEEGSYVFPGALYIESGIICEVEELSKVPSPNWILPRFINAHTHIGDSVLKDPCLGISFDSSVSSRSSDPSGSSCPSYTVSKNLDSLVKPPYGLKHKILSETDSDTVVLSMEMSIRDMYYTGTGLFADFRENGLLGINLLQKAYMNAELDICPIVLGRPDPIPDCPDSHKTEESIQSLLSVFTKSEGIGMSGSNDMPFSFLETVVSAARKHNKIFAIHAGEKDSSDIESSLSLNPDFLIHMTYADSNHIRHLSDSGIPVVVCPGSNLATGVGMPPISDFLEQNICVSIGTDNVMLNSLDMFEEMRLLSKLFNLTDEVIFKMCTLNGANTLNSNHTGSLDIGKKADIMILNGKSPNLSHVCNPLAGFVRRARPDDIVGIL